MVKIDIRLFEEQPQLSIDDSELVSSTDDSRTGSSPALVLSYSGLRLSLSKPALRQLRQTLSIGEAMLKNYRRFKTIPLPLDFD